MSVRSFVPMTQKYNRVVVLVDMDCFYCQVEEKLDPQLKGQPIAVVQYNEWRGGGIIAVNYAARAKGVTRHMRGDEAKEHCPEIQLVRVPNIHEKADLSKYREAGKEVANVLQRFTPLLERASVDEAYLDITEAVNKRLENMNAGSFMLQPQGLVNTYAVGYERICVYLNLITKYLNHPTDNDNDFDSDIFAQAHDTTNMSAAAMHQSDIRLLIGAAIAGEVRSAVKAQTGYECSAGIAHNKILAKLACGMNKPNKQTILPLAQIPALFDTLPLGKIRGLGGKFGEEICETLQIRYLGELLAYTEQELQRKFDEKNGTWLYNICRGIDLEAVTPRFYSKSIGCCKKFPGRNNITGLNTLRHWLGELANEVCDRMEKDMEENNRRAKQMVVSFIQEIDGEEVSSSRSAPLNAYDKETLIKCSLDVLQTHTKQFFKTGSTLALNNPIKFLGISVGKFETIQSGQGKLQEMFANLAAKRKQTESVSGPVNTLSSETDGERDMTAPNSTTNASCQVVGTKPTLMQNFLRRGIEEDATAVHTNKLGDRAKDSNTENLSDALVIKNVLDSTETLKQPPEPQGPPEARSFFLNALKKQRGNEDKNEKSAAKDHVSINTSSSDTSADISKSFFAKILKHKNVVSEQTFSAQGTATTINNSSIDLSDDSHEWSQQRLNQPVNSAEQSEINKKLDNETSSSKNKRKYTELLDQQKQAPSMSSNSKRQSTESYESSYVEFAMPELRAEFLQMIKCDMCNANVPSDERSMQLHQDHHVAMQLSQQLREEYRTHIKTKLTVNKSTVGSDAGASVTTVPNKKAKKSPAQAAKATSGANITKFLKPTSSTNATKASTGSSESQTPARVITVLDDTMDTIICDECKSSIAVNQIQEHKDFHIAKSLQRQLNLLEVRTVTVANKSPKNSCTSAINTTHSGTIKNTNIKPITQFFSQSNC
ncbi:DNA polymerase eta [Eurosta solidaginis]|uniref:DNA polymerase eta n=1 Tax=Eurosta solidaginis TaxID=178769 RepID=UPI0035310AB9